MPPARMPAAEVHIDEALVRRLLDAQFPQWAGLDVRAMPSLGWDNVLFRLGPDLLVRMPRRRIAAELVEREHRWLPELAPRLPVPIPVPVGRGHPEAGYPWPWSICPWFPGRMAAESRLAEREVRVVAQSLGEFLAALHVPAPDDAPDNEWRGVPLAARDEVTRGHLAAVASLVNTSALSAAWDQALSVAPWTGPPLWLHGDLHPANLLVDDGRLGAVLDFGDLTAGDPATDLAVAWMLLPAAARPVLCDAAGADAATWARARGWALALGLACLANSADNPVIAGIGRRTIEVLLAER